MRPATSFPSHGEQRNDSTLDCRRPQTLSPGLRLLLAECGDLAIVAETSNYAETLAAVREQELDLAILDLSTPGRDGIEIVAHIRSIQPSMKTLVLSTRSTQSTLMRALNVSLDGFMAKESGVEELVGAIHHLAYGEPVLARYIG